MARSSQIGTHLCAERGRLAWLIVSALAVALLAALAADSASARVPRDFYGVVSQGRLSDADFRKMGGGNVGTLRATLAWRQVQREAGSCAEVCDWSGFDRIVGNAADEGVRVLPVLNHTASFVSDDPQVPPLRKRADRRAWKGFLKAAVRRYGRGGSFWEGRSKRKPIKEWQVWNEPSSPTHFHPKPAPKKYAKLVKLSHRAIANVDRKAKVVLAGLFATPRGSRGGKGGGIYLPVFLKRFYKAKRIKRHFDAAAVHPFAPNLKGVKFQIRLARKKMRGAGDRKARLWISEIGWASDGPKKNQMVKSRKGQERILRKAFRLFRKKRKDWRLRAVNWFSLRDIPRNTPNVCHACPWTGLLDLDGSPKPAWRAFKRFT